MDKVRLKNNVKDAWTDSLANGGDNAADQLDYFCEKLADVLVDEIRQLKINYSGGLVVGSTPVTGVINHTVS